MLCLPSVRQEQQRLGGGPSQHHPYLVNYRSLSLVPGQPALRVGAESVTIRGGGYLPPAWLPSVRKPGVSSSEICGIPVPPKLILNLSGGTGIVCTQHFLLPVLGIQEVPSAAFLMPSHGGGRGGGDIFMSKYPLSPLFLLSTKLLLTSLPKGQRLSACLVVASKVPSMAALVSGAEPWL